MRVISWLIVVGFMSVSSIALSHQRGLDPVQNLSLTVTSPLTGAVRDLSEPINDYLLGIADRGGLKRENQELRAELERLQVLLAKQQNAQQRVTELEDALGVKQNRPEDRLLAADVIATDLSALKRAIAIDRGRGDGLDEGMVVLSRNGSLIGTVSRAYQDYAWIQLITDPESAVNAQVHLNAAPSSPTPAPSPAASPQPSPSNTPPPETVLRLIAAGDLRDGVTLALLPSDARIEPGNLVLTSGHGGNYPRGILIGTVTSAEERPQSPFKSAKVEPASDLSNLDTVLILLSFQPARLSGP